MIRLTDTEIVKLASRKGVRRMAVENFLGTADGGSLSNDSANLNMDAGMYGWNTATVTAIQIGLKKMYKE